MPIRINHAVIRIELASFLIIPGSGSSHFRYSKWHGDATNPVMVGFPRESAHCVYLMMHGIEQVMVDLEVSLSPSADDTHRLYKVVYCILYCCIRVTSLCNKYMKLITASP